MPSTSNASNLTTNPIVTATAERNRLFWHSRRGMLELDLMLLPFLETRYLELSPALQADYQRLITHEDQDLFLWLMQRRPAADTTLQPVIDLIASHAQQGNLDKFKQV